MGECQFGDNCHFAHGQADLRARPQVMYSVKRVELHILVRLDVIRCAVKHTFGPLRVNATNPFVAWFCCFPPFGCVCQLYVYLVFVCLCIVLLAPRCMFVPGREAAEARS